MSGQIRVGTNLEKIKHISVGTGSGMTKIKHAYVYQNGVFVPVWSGASAVTYHYGTSHEYSQTVEVDEGQDVLHPSFSVAVSGYTLYGWTQAGGVERETTLVATGEPMDLYAIYNPNTLVVASGSYGDWSYDSAGWHDNYSASLNPSYVYGNASALAKATNNTQESSSSFTISFGRYQSASLTVKATFSPNDIGYLTHGWAYLDGTQFFEAVGSTRDKTQTFNVNSGSHTLKISAISYGDYQEAGSVGITNITLSNPIAWT